MGAQKAAASKPGGRMKLAAMAAAPVLLLVLGGGAYVTGVLPFGYAADAAVGTPRGEPPAQRAASGRGVHFVDLPEILVNLDGGGQRMRFLKLKVALEVSSSGDAERVLQLSPRVMDSFQLYLRALRPDDLNGATGLYRLKEELLARVNAAVDRVEVHDILFKEMLVQ